MPYGYKQPGNWKTTRRRILARDHNTCACGSPATQVDHIINVAAGGTHNDTNLQAICHPCHNTKTKLEQQAGKTRNKPTKPRHPGLI